MTVERGVIYDLRLVITFAVYYVGNVVGHRNNWKIVATHHYSAGGTEVAPYPSTSFPAPRARARGYVFLTLRLYPRSA